MNAWTKLWHGFIKNIQHKMRRHHPFILFLGILSLLITLNPHKGLTAKGTHLSESRLQTCISKTGIRFQCMFDQGECFQVTPLPYTEPSKRYTIKPCERAPLVLDKNQDASLKSAETHQSSLVATCRDLKAKYAEGNFSDKTAKELPPLIWKLVHCLQNEADVEYSPDKEIVLFDRITQLLTLLTRHTESELEAHRELAILYEEFYKDYEKALKHYKKSRAPDDTYTYISMGRAACLSGDSDMQKRGLAFYIKAIQSGTLIIDVDNTSTQHMSLNALLHQCGFKKLIPVLESEKSLYITTENKDADKTLAYISKIIQ
jgi:hypothetical protein